MTVHIKIKEYDIHCSCPVTPATGPFKLTRAFEADMTFSSYTGTGWCVLTGKMDATRWYTLNGGVPVTTLYFQVTVGFCAKEDGVGFGQGFEQQKCIDVSLALLQCIHGHLADLI